MPYLFPSQSNSFLSVMNNMNNIHLLKNNVVDRNKAQS